MRGKIGKRWNQRGAALLYAVFAITAVAVLGTGIYFLTTTSTFSGLSANDRNRAYQLALAGKDYAVTKNLENTASTYPDGRDFTLSNGDKFNLKIVNDVNPNITRITSTGFVKDPLYKDIRYKAEQTITVRIDGFNRWADTGFAKDIQAFTKPVESKTGLITTDTAAGKVSLGKITTGSAAWENNFGALWYRGNAAQGDCRDGQCRFGTGFRAFFVFQINAGAADADGFAFAFFGGSAEDPASSLVANDAFSVGGDWDKGELMGYAGDSRLITGYLDGKTRLAAGCPTPLGCAAGRGIQPPKMAIEFDAFDNQCCIVVPTPVCCTVAPVTNLCRCDCNVCQTGSRCDGERDHMAYVFWGDETPECGSMIGKNTFDDNKHGVPSTPTQFNPQNSRSPFDLFGVDTSSYYDSSAPIPANWLTNISSGNIYAFRIEVTRSPTPNASGNYEYTLKSWIKQCADADCTNYSDASIFANTKQNYEDPPNPPDPPTLTRSIPITPALHQKFETFYFGWTTATGSSTQEILLSRFRMNFRK